MVVDHFVQLANCLERLILHHGGSPLCTQASAEFRNLQQNRQYRGQVELIGVDDGQIEHGNAQMVVIKVGQNWFAECKALKCENPICSHDKLVGNDVRVSVNLNRVRSTHLLHESQLERNANAPQVLQRIQQGLRTLYVSVVGSMHDDRRIIVWRTR